MIFEILDYYRKMMILGKKTKIIRYFCPKNLHMSKFFCIFASQNAKERKKTMKDYRPVESPIEFAQGGTQDYLTAEELISRLEPRIRAMFR